jgi:hypothetical protein
MKQNIFVQGFLLPIFPKKRSKQIFAIGWQSSKSIFRFFMYSPRMYIVHDSEKRMEEVTSRRVDVGHDIKRLYRL